MKSAGNPADAITAQAARLQAGSTLDPDSQTGALFEGPKWSSKVITWSLAPGTSAETALPAGTSLEADVGQAFATWAKASGLTFEEVGDPTQADIRVGWNSFDTSDTGVLGYTNLGGQNGAILPHVDISLEDPGETSLATDANGALAYTGTNTELSQLLLHEIGHALGLADSSSTTSIMGAVLSDANRTLDATDIAAIQTLYPAEDPSTSATASVVARTGSLSATSPVATTAGVLGHGSTFRVQAGQIIDAIASFGATSSSAVSASAATAPPANTYDHSLAAAA